jgi:hypothetical protein
MSNCGFAFGVKLELSIGTITWSYHLGASLGAIAWSNTP